MAALNADADELIADFQKAVYVTLIIIPQYLKCL